MKQDLFTILENNYKEQQEQFKNRLARELKIEYLDFKSSVNMPMTIDLGENYKGQLLEIFKILEKSGIKF